MSEDLDVRRFRGLYTEHFRPVYGYLLRRAPTAEAAADVAAETFTVAWRRLSDVPEGRETRLWLYGVARRVLANAHRAERRRGQLVERLGALAAERLATADRPDLRADRLQEALEALSGNDREVLVLAAWEELTPAEIGVVLGLPAATVRTRLHRARARLREHLSPAGAPINPTYVPELEA